MNTIAKRFAGSFAACALAFGLAACGGSASPADTAAPEDTAAPAETAPAVPTDEELIEASIDELISVFKNPTEETFAQFIGDEDMSTFEQYDLDPYEYFRNMFKRLDYTVDDVQVNGDTAEVALTVSNVNLNAVITETSDEFNENIAEYIDGVDMSDEDAAMKVLMNKLFSLVYEQIDTSDDIVTSEFTISLTKGAEGWSVDESSVERFVSALYGGIGA